MTTPLVSPRQTSGLRFALRALSSRNYALFFSGQIVSLVGTWLSMLATSWLVFRLAKVGEADREALLLGLVTFAGQLPVFLLAPVSGVLIDRWNRHHVLLVTQSLSMLQSFAMAFLIFQDLISIPQIIALSIFQGLVNAVDIPTRQAFVVQLVDRPEDLSNAIALNSSMVQTARLIGPAVAGFLIYAVGEGLCFLIDGFSFLGVLAALSCMRLPKKSQRQKHGTFTAALREGLAYAWTSQPIRSLLMLVALVSLMAMSQSVLMPIYADEILGGGERTLGLLLGSSGLGALLASVYLATRRSVLGLGRVIAVGPVLLGATLVALAWSRSLPLSMLLLVVAGSALLAQTAAANTILQTIVEEDKRGRVMSLFAMCFIGMAPFGSLLAGAVADWLGVPWTLAAAGLVCVVAGLLFARELRVIRPMIRPIYQKKGILPPVIAGIEAAAIQTEAARD